MGRPPNTIARTKQIRATLLPLARYFPEGFNRSTLDAILMERYELGKLQITRMLADGEVLGYWHRKQGRSGPRGAGVGTVHFVLEPGQEVAPFPST